MEESNQQSLNNTNNSINNYNKRQMPSILRSPLDEKSDLLNTDEITNISKMAKEKFIEVMGSSYNANKNNNFNLINEINKNNNV